MRTFLTILLGFCSVGLWGQLDYRLGTMTGINLNTKLNAGWQLNTSAEARFNTDFQPWNEEAQNYDFSLVDFTAIAAHKIGYQWQAGGGALLRVRQNRTDVRTIQQLAWVKRLGKFRLGQRFRTDQTFVQNDPVEWRFRYRLSSDFPLSGESIDDGELYGKVNNEWLLSLKGNTEDLEMRIVPTLGLRFTDRNKLELAFDNRYDEFLDSTGRWSFWWRLNWFLKI